MVEVQEGITGANLALHLKAMRRAAGLTPEQLAVAAGVSYSLVQQIERGCRTSQGSCDKLLAALSEAGA